jgi:hypothetical protein
MRCSDLTKQLSTATDPVASPEVESHLASCEPCARFAQMRRQFDHLWRDTRPIPATSAEFDALWNRVQAANYAPAQKKSPWPSRFTVTAQAAAILLACGFVWTSLSNRPKPLPPNTPALGALQSYSVDEGQNLILRIDSGRVTQIIADDMALSDTVQIAGDFEMYNYLESLE